MSHDNETIDCIDDEVVGYVGDDYEPSTAFAVPPPPGEYTFLRVSETEKDYLEGDGRFEKDNKAYFWANFKVQIQGGKYDGRIAFAGGSTATFDRKNSSLQDFLLASRSSFQPRTVADYKRDIPKVFGPFNAVTNWEWRCRDCEETFLIGYANPKPPKKFKGPKPIVRFNETKDDQGKIISRAPHHIVSCPTCNQDVGANLVVKRFVVPQGAKGARASVSVSTSTLAPVPAGLAPAAG